MKAVRDMRSSHLSRSMCSNRICDMRAQNLPLPVALSSTSPNSSQSLMVID